MVFRKPLSMPKKIGSLCLTKVIGDVSWGFLYKGVQAKQRVWIVEFFPVSGYFRETTGCVEPKFKSERDILERIKGTPLHQHKQADFVEITDKEKANGTVYFVYHQTEIFFFKRLILEQRSLVSSLLFKFLVYFQLEDTIKKLVEIHNHYYMWFSPASVFINKNQKVMLLETPFMVHGHLMDDSIVPETIYTSPNLYHKKLDAVNLDDCLYSVRLFLIELLAGHPLGSNHLRHDHLFEKDLEELLKNYECTDLMRMTKFSFSFVV